MPNTKPVESPKRSVSESEDVAIKANRIAADQMAKEMVEGLRKLSQQKASRRNPNQAA